MIRFGCPRCKSVLEAPDHKAGVKFSCPKCQQRLQIPQPSTPPVTPGNNKTVLGSMFANGNDEPKTVTDGTQGGNGTFPVACPKCNRIITLGSQELSLTIECAGCNRRFIPAELLSSSAVLDAQAASPRKRSDEKHCVECGSIIRARAELCPKCGVRQPYTDDDREYTTRLPSRDGVSVPLLISAIANILVGLIWLATCFGVVLAVPMFVLCIFEFAIWASADSVSRQTLAGRAKVLSIFEIIIGLFNTPTLICGIIVLINAGKLTRRYDN